MIGSARSFFAATAASNSALVMRSALRDLVEAGRPVAAPDEADALGEALGPGQRRRAAQDLGREEDGRGAIRDEEAVRPSRRATSPTSPRRRPSAPSSLATFQMAGTFRDQPEIGSRARVFGSSSWKSATPWSTGDRPVASVVQMSGEIIGLHGLEVPGPPARDERREIRQEAALS